MQESKSLISESKPMRRFMRGFKRIAYNNTFITSVIAGIVVFLIVLWIDLSQQTAQNFILIATFAAIVWYSLETRLLKNATNIANASQTEPLLVLQYRKKENEDKLYIVNYGKGLAFNIKIEVKNIQGFFNFSIQDPNPLGHMEEKVLSRGAQNTSENTETDVKICFDKIEGDERVERQRVYKVLHVENGYRIELLG